MAPALYRAYRFLERSEVQGGAWYLLGRAGQTLAARLFGRLWRWTPGGAGVPASDRTAADAGVRSLTLIGVPLGAPETVAHWLGRRLGAGPNSWVCLSLSHSVPPALETRTRARDIGQVWTDQPIHIAIHERQNALRLALDRVASTDPMAAEAVDLLRYPTFRFGIVARRIGEMARQTVDPHTEGVVIWNVPRWLDLSDVADLVSTAARRPVRPFRVRWTSPGAAAIRPVSPGGGRRRAAERYLASAPARLRPVDPGPPVGPDAEGGLIYAALTARSRYHFALVQIIAAARTRGGALSVLAPSARGVAAARRLHAQARRLRLGRGPDTDGRAAFLRLRAILARHDPPADTVDALVWRWLGRPERLYDLEAALAVRCGVEAALRQAPVRRLLLLPHWSATAPAVAQAARRCGVEVVGVPLFPIAAHQASMVGWDLMDRIAVYGSQAGEAVRAVGLSAHITPIGHFSAARLLGRDGRAARRAVARQTGDLPAGRRLVLVATSRIDPNEEDWIAALARACAARSDAVVVVKTHPTLSASQGAAVLRARDTLPTDQRTALTLARDGDIADFVTACDVCVTDMSGVGIDAVLANKPLLAVNLVGRSFPSNDYVAMGVADGASSIEGLISALHRILDASGTEPAREGRSAAIARLNAHDDADAAGRLVDLLQGRSPETAPPVT